MRNNFPRVSGFKERPVEGEEPPHDVGAYSKEKSERVLAAILCHLAEIYKLNCKFEFAILNLLDCFLQIITALRGNSKFVALDLSLD